MISPLSTFRSVGIAVFVGFGFLTSASAVPTSEEEFVYAAGALNGRAGGTGWAGAWTISGAGANVTNPGFSYTDANSAVLPVAGGKATLPGGDAGNFRLTSNSPDTVGTLYVSFLGQMTANPIGGYAGLSLFQGTAPAGEFLFFGKPTNETNWGFDLKGGVVNTEVGTTPASALSLLVYRVDFGSPTTVRLFVNPTLGTEPAVASATGSRTNFTWDTIRIQSGNGAVGSFDEIRIGTDYASVAPVPEPGSFVVILSACGALGWVRPRKVCG